MTNGREITPPPCFSTPPQIPNIVTSERLPMTTTVFTATTPENTPYAYCASTSANPNPMISPAFVEANYEVLESLLRERRRQIRNEDLQTGLEYFSEDYDEEREIELRPEPNREATPPLRLRSHVVRRQREIIIGFEEASNREGSRGGRNAEGSRPSEIETRENGNKGVNLPPLLAAHLGRNESCQPLQSSLTSVHEGYQPSTNIGGNLPPNGLHEEQHIFGFVHGLRTRSLAEHLSMDLPSTYKGLMEKTYTWIKAREVATNGALNEQRKNFERTKYYHFHKDYGHDTNQCRELKHQIEEAVKSGQVSHLAKGLKKKKEKKSDTQLGERKKDGKDATPVEAPILMIRRESHNQRKRPVEGNYAEAGEITFPPLRNRCLRSSSHL
ncbi:hypothetical protein Tco_0088431 [Tanacetum coccineum]